MRINEGKNNYQTDIDLSEDDFSASESGSSSSDADYN